MYDNYGDEVHYLTQCSLRPVLYAPITEATNIQYPFRCKSRIRSYYNFQIVGSSNGLIRVAADRDIFLWNPAIRKSAELGASWLDSCRIWVWLWWMNLRMIIKCSEFVTTVTLWWGKTGRMFTAEAGKVLMLRTDPLSNILCPMWNYVVSLIISANVATKNRWLFGLPYTSFYFFFFGFPLFTQLCYNSHLF